MSTGHRYFEIDRVLGLAVEAERECYRESRRLGAGQRAGASEGFSLCVFDILSENYRGLKVDDDVAVG